MSLPSLAHQVRSNAGISKNTKHLRDSRSALSKHNPVLGRHVSAADGALLARQPRIQTGAKPCGARISQCGRTGRAKQHADHMLAMHAPTLHAAGFTPRGS